STPTTPSPFSAWPHSLLTSPCTAASPNPTTPPSTSTPPTPSAPNRSNGSKPAAPSTSSAAVVWRLLGDNRCVGPIAVQPVRGRTRAAVLGPGASPTAHRPPCHRRSRLRRRTPDGRAPCAHRREIHPRCRQL